MDSLNSIWDYSFLSAGIPKEYFFIKYSDILNKLDNAQQTAFKQFMEKKVKRLFFLIDDDDEKGPDRYSVPYVLFRRMMTINLFLHGEARIADAINIQNKESIYNGEKLYGIFRIDPKVTLNKHLLELSIGKACDNDASIIMTSHTDEMSDLLGSYFGLVAKTFAFITL